MKYLISIFSGVRGFSSGDRHNLILWAEVNPYSLPGIFLNCSAIRNDVCPGDICTESYLSATTQLLLMKKWLLSLSFLFLCFTSFLQNFHISCNSSQALQHPLNTSISVPLSCKWTFSELPGSLFQFRRPGKETLHQNRPPDWSCKP